LANEDLIKRAVKLLIYNNRSDLVDGLSFAGTDLAISQITRTVLTVGRLPGLHLAVVCPSWEEHANAYVPGGSSIRYSHAKKQIEAEYEIEVHSALDASPSGGEAVEKYLQQFENAQAAFDTFVARLANLFRDNETIPPETGSFTIELLPKDGTANDRRIAKESRTGWYADGAGIPIATLWDILRFRVGTCGEPDPLT
jgi:hypothetical protein